MTNEEIAAKLAEYDNKHKVSEHRLTDLEKKTDKIESLTLSVQKLAMSVEIMAKEQVDYREKQNELAGRILEVERKPEKEKASKLDQIVMHIFTLVSGAFISYVLYNVFGL